MDEEEKYWSNLENIYVHNVYESISSKYDEFFRLSQSNRFQKNLKDNQSDNCSSNEFKKDYSTSNLIYRNRRPQQKINLWPKVKQFLLQIEPFSLIADVGCGEGKYLNVNSHVLSIGSDRSSSLCELASQQNSSNSIVCNKNQIVICDNLYLPFKSDLFDAVVSIGVIHHLSTPKRRVRAIKELVRILKPGGKIMIYVWAMEQRLRKFNSQDVLVPMLNTNNSKSEFKPSLRRDLSNNSAGNSDDSNDESNSEKNLFNLKSNSTKSLLSSSDNNQESAQSDIDIMTNIKEEFCASFKTIEQSEKKDENNNDINKVEFNISTYHSEIDLINQDVVPKKDDESNNLKKNQNFIDNLKNFFSEKFTLKSPKELKSTDSSSTKFNLVINQSSPNLTNLENCSNNLTKTDSIERYKKIIEDHKALLPEGFVIRQFPYSSCMNTFEEDVNKNKSKNEEKNLDFISTTSSSSLSPSPINQYSPNHLSSMISKNKLNEDIISKKIIRSDSNENKKNNTQNKKSNTSSQPNLEDDSNNSSNKRYYHVFKKHELDNLIKENCPNLIIYDSYYDHGNWSICARKEK